MQDLILTFAETNNSHQYVQKVATIYLIELNKTNSKTLICLKKELYMSLELILSKIYYFKLFVALYDAKTAAQKRYIKYISIFMQTKFAWVFNGK